MTDLPANAIRFPKRPPLRLVDCQGETMSALKGSVREVTGMDPEEFLATQAKCRDQKRDAELFKEWKEVTEALFKGSKRDPFDHASIFLQDMKGRRS